MGVVWSAERVGIERPVVVKFLQAVLSDRPGAVDRFEREARATARLNHPNCVQLVDFGLDDGQPYLVVEYVEGQTLAELLDHGPLEARRAVLICIQVLAGLEHAHERGILHRDLKPANLMIVEAVGYIDFVKILDFGLAKILGETERREVTVHGVALGTPGYMSPEQAAGMPSDLRADIYSTGAVLYHLLTGVKVFEGANVHSILRKHREETPAPPRKLRGPGAISAELDAAVNRAMARDPEKRFQTAAELRRALEATPEAQRGGTVPSSRPTVPRRDVTVEETRASRRSSRGRPGKGRSWPLTMGLAAAAALVGAGLAVWALRSTIPPAAAVVEPAAVRPVDDKTIVPPAHVQVRPLTPDGAAGSPVDAAEVAPAQVTPLPPPVSTTEDEDPDDGAGEDLHEPPAAPVAAPRREAREVRSIADVRVLVRRGETDLAIAGLYQLRKRPGLTRERQAEIAALLGHLYFDRRWISDALKEYRYALSLDLRTRSDPTIINNTVRALGDRATAGRARRVLIDFVGRSAIPALRRAQEKPDTRRRATEVLGKLGVTR
jgi:serine/threonine-protein kinase